MRAKEVVFARKMGALLPKEAVLAREPGALPPKEAVLAREAGAFSPKEAVLTREAGAFSPKEAVLTRKAGAFSPKTVTGFPKEGVLLVAATPSFERTPGAFGWTGARFVAPSAAFVMATVLRQHPNARRIASPAVRAKMRAVIGDQLQKADADDVVQKTYLRLLTAIDRLPEDEDGLLGFVVVVTVGEVKRRHKRAAVDQARFTERRELEDDEREDGALSPQLREEFREIHAWAVKQQADGRVDPDCLRWAERIARGDTFEEIAEDEGIPAATVRKRMERFRKHMKEHRLAYAGGLSVLVLALVFFLRPPSRPDIVAEPTPPTTPSAVPTAVATETPDQIAARLRHEAQLLCDAKKFTECEAKLYEAGNWDAEIGAKPDVIQMQHAIEAWKAAEAKKPHPPK
ncbi:MAG TPA: sigma-70 family RNA polymerase sigma factor [Polyangiaceae bacterium]